MKGATTVRRAAIDSPALPAYTLLTDSLVTDLRRVTAEIRDRTHRDVRRESSPGAKRDALDSGLSSWTGAIYKLVRDSLQEYVKHALVENRKSFSSQVLRWAEEQTSVGLAEGLGYIRVHENKKQQNRYIHELRGRLSSLGARARVQRANDPARWLREYSSEWMKLACDDPRDGLSQFIGWRAPAWACDSAGHSIDDRATEEQTENLLRGVASDLRTSLENARFDAFDPFLQQHPRSKPPRKFASPHLRAMERLWLHNPNASAKDIAHLLDKESVSIPTDWLRSFSPDQRTWTRILNHLNYKNKATKMICEVRGTLRKAGCIPRS